LRKKLSRIEHVLIVKVSFERRKIAKVFMTHVQVFFGKSLSKATFERKLSSVSLPLVTPLATCSAGREFSHSSMLRCHKQLAVYGVNGALCTMTRTMTIALNLSVDSARYRVMLP